MRASVFFEHYVVWTCTAGGGIGAILGAAFAVSEPTRRNSDKRLLYRIIMFPCYVFGGAALGVIAAPTAPLVYVVDRFFFGDEERKD